MIAVSLEQLIVMELMLSWAMAPTAAVEAANRMIDRYKSPSLALQALNLAGPDGCVTAH